MANKILLRRGLKSKLPTLSAGEPAYTTDSREFFMGTGSGNVNMGGSQWYTGTAMSGTSTSSTYSYTSCPLVKVGDIYLNTSYGYIYQCTTAGSGTTARWQYKACIRGPQGATGATGSYFPSNGYASMDDLTSDVNDLVGNEKLAPPTSITIACRDSQHQWLANYICPDNQDHTSIFQQAINQLYIGGKITVLEGDYTIKGPLSLSGKKIIIEGMGSGTSINVNGTFVISGGNNNITIRDIDIVASNVDGGIFDLTNTDKINLDNCSMSVSIKSGIVASTDVTAAVNGSGNTDVHFNNLSLTATFNANDVECGAVFRYCNVHGDMSKIKVTRASGCDYNVNTFMVCKGRVTNTSLMSDHFILHGTDPFVIDNCYVKCYSITQIEYDNHGSVINSRIYITGKNTIHWALTQIANCQISIPYTTTKILCKAEMFNNNKIGNSASDMFVFSQYAIIVGNKSKYTMTSSTPTGAVIANNVVHSNMSNILTDEE
jgi:hypothetical protein